MTNGDISTILTTVRDHVIAQEDGTVCPHIPKFKNTTYPSHLPAVLKKKNLAKKPVMRAPKEEVDPSDQKV